MKLETKKRKQLERVKEWLAKARPDLQEKYMGGGHGEFSLLIAVEQLVKYLELEQLDQK
jgi:hypothetical protein